MLGLYALAAGIQEATNNGSDLSDFLSALPMAYKPIRRHIIISL